jgi:hypothetical protein
MRRTFTQIKLDDNTTRNVVVLYDEPCTAGTQFYNDRQVLFLKYLADDQRLINPDTAPFQTLNVSYNGVCWCATAVTIITV